MVTQRRTGASAAHYQLDFVRVAYVFPSKQGSAHMLTRPLAISPLKDPFDRREVSLSFSEGLQEISAS